MALWTDIITPQELTGYARAALSDYEASRGTLARFLPNREVADIVVRFLAGSTGLIDVADFRAYDAEPTIGKMVPRTRTTIELPALGRNIPVSEYNQLRARNSSPSDDAVRETILTATNIAARAVADAVERVRGVVLSTGVATISNEGGFSMADSFGRSGSNDVTAGTLWSTTSADGLGNLTTWTDTYRDANGEPAGCILMSTRVLRAFSKLDQNKIQLLNSASRPATTADVNGVIEGASLPPIVLYDRNVSIAGSKTKVLPDNKLFLLPAPVDTGAWQDTELGATYWGQTLTSGIPEYQLADTEMPGLVVGAYRGEKPPMLAEVISDAIALPTLANADLSFAATVL
jgi:hypothetical protein